MDPTTLAIGLVSGLIGFAYFMYGKKQKKVVPLAAGLIMCTVPYLVTDNLTVVIICLVATVVPWVIRV